MKAINSIIRLLGSIPADKLLHFAVSSIVAVVSVAVAHICGAVPFFALLVSFVFVSIVGLTKELIIDSQPDPWDLVANYAGALVVWTVFIVVTLTS